MCVAVSFMCLFLKVPWVGLLSVIMAIPGHTHFLGQVLTFYHIILLLNRLLGCYPRPLEECVPKI